MNFETWPLGLQVLAAVPLVIGGVFSLLGAVGLWRFENVYQRLHLPTLTATLGLGGLLAAGVVVALVEGRSPWGAGLVALLVFVTAPVSALMLAQAARHRQEPGGPDQA